MLNQFIHRMEQLSGACLGGVGIGVLVGNVLICFVILFRGAAPVVEFLA